MTEATNLEFGEAHGGINSNSLSSPLDERMGLGTDSPLEPFDIPRKGTRSPSSDCAMFTQYRAYEW